MPNCEIPQSNAHQFVVAEIDDEMAFGEGFDGRRRIDDVVRHRRRHDAIRRFKSNDAVRQKRLDGIGKGKFDARRAAVEERSKETRYERPT